MAKAFQIAELDEKAEEGYCPYGAARRLWKCKDPEVMISGPAETGKTLGVLHKLDALAWKYPRMQAAIVRKTYKSMPGSVLQTFEEKVLGAWNQGDGEDLGEFDQRLTPVRKFGGAKPDWYDYPNGSRIWVGGMDNPTKVLSSERDVIYVNQAEELTQDEWETLTTRVTGRAGHMPYAQIIGDCNPSHDKHWILGRRDDKKMTFLESRHEDNPMLYDQETGQITRQGQRSLMVLDNLTGVRYLRLRKGIWAAAEGVVYELDRAVHCVPRFDIPAEWARYISIDFGFTNPFVAQWWAVDGDGRLYRYREIYVTQMLVEDIAREMRRISAGELIRYVVGDHDAEDRATFERHFGMVVKPAYKSISPGIQAVQTRLKKAGDDKARIFFLEDSLVQRDESLSAARQPVCTEDEFDVYVWPKGQEGKPIREVPVDMYNHGMDAMRYFVAEIDNVREMDKATLPMPSVPVVGVGRPGEGKEKRPRRRGRPVGLSGKIKE